MVVDFFVKSQVPIISVFMQIYLMPVGLDVPCKKKSDCFFVVFLGSGATFKKNIVATNLTAHWSDMFVLLCCVFWLSPNTVLCIMPKKGFVVCLDANLSCAACAFYREEVFS